VALVAKQIATGPAQTPESVEFECAKRVLVSLRIQDAHAAAWLGGKALKVTVGTATEVTHSTDDNGYFTLTYDGDGDLPADDVTIVWDENKRSGKKKINTATLQDNTALGGRLHIYCLTIPVAGTFTLEIDVKAWRPWKTTSDFTGHYIELKGAKAKLDWQEPPGTAKTLDAAIKASASTAYATFTKADLPCGTDITITNVIPGSTGYGSWVAVGDGELARATSVAATTDGVTFTSNDGASRVVVNAANHGTRVRVFIGHEFKKVFIAGEGTYFDYAVGLAELHQSMDPAGKGVLWVYASQYDVTLTGNLPTRRNALNPANGATNRDVNQRTRVTGAAGINLFIVRTATADDAGTVGRFDVTDTNHWAALTRDHGTFDATIFNNPHPGYGVHLAVLFGLATGDRKVGRYVCVHTIRYAVPAVGAISDGNWTARLRLITSKRFDLQRPFVRGGASLNYQNRPSATFPTWNLDGGFANKTINEAFQYTDGSGIGNDPPTTDAYYGGATEFKNAWNDHYEAKITTVGLHAHVIRCYRRHAPSVLKVGGKVLLNGSASYEGALVAEVKKADDTVLAEAMVNDQTWSDHLYFAHYPTNFTSTRFHPSQFPNGYEQKYEPSLRNAVQYSWTKT
jgi:hypothetical protein